MLKKLKSHLIPLLVLFILSLTPFLWLKQGEYIAGHDAGTPFSPTDHFLDRLEVWTYRYGGGADQTFALGGFFIHGFEAILNQFPISLTTQQQIQFSTYFLLIGLSMYVSANLVIKKLHPMLGLVAAVVYQINHFLLQAWFIAERTKFSSYIALPLTFAVLLLFFNKRISPIKGGILIATILTIFNGGGFLPLYGAIIITFLTVASIQVWIEKKFISQLSRFTLLLITFSACYVIGNSYWLFPYIWYVKNSFRSLVDESGGVSGIINWTESISLTTSSLNLFKIQGIQEWYANRQHPYAQFYFSNPFLILGSYLPLFVITFGVVEFAKKKQAVLGLLLIILFIAMFFMGGSHKPFGFAYIFLLQHLPGFIAFRTPYYKFAPAFFLAFSLIIAYLGSQLDFIKKKAAFFSIIFLVFYLAYQFPFFKVNFFQYTQNRTTKIYSPDYVFQYRDYIRANANKLSKTLLYPGLTESDNVSQYNWGYWSLATVQSLLDRHQYVIPSPPKLSYQSQLTSELYDALGKQKPYWLNIAASMGIDSILVQEDFSQDGISKTKEFLLSDPRLKLIKEFGPWSVFQIPNQKNVVSNYIQVDIPDSESNEKNSLYSVILENNLSAEQFILSDKKIPSLQRIGFLSKASCIDCQIRRELVYKSSETRSAFKSSKFLSFMPYLKSDTNDDINTKTLQNISDLFRMYEFVGAVPKMNIWRDYNQNLEKYEHFISSLELNKKNALPVKNIFININYQTNILRSISLKINNQEEGEQFLEAITKLNRISENIRQLSWITENPNTYKLLLTAKESGNYNAYLYLPLLNAKSTNNIIVSLNGKPFQSKPIITGDWAEYKNIPISEENNTLEVKDTALSLNVNTPQQITLSPDRLCSDLYVDNLERGLYTTEIEASTENSNITTTVHMDLASQNTPLLPYWGREFKLSASPNMFSTIAFDIPKKDQAKISICAFDVKTKTSIRIHSFQLNRMVLPLFYLYKHDQQPSSASNSAVINKLNNTKNTYQIQTHDPGLVLSPHPFNSNWKTTYSDAKQIAVNDNQGAYLLPPGIHQFSENYENQKYFQYGAFISIAYFSSIALFQVLKLVKNKVRR